MKITLTVETKDEWLVEPKIDAVVDMLRHQAEQVSRDWYSQALTQAEYLRREKHLPITKKD